MPELPASDEFKQQFEKVMQELSGFVTEIKATIAQEGKDTQKKLQVGSELLRRIKVADGNHMGEEKAMSTQKELPATHESGEVTEPIVSSGPGAGG
jgi:hypothetical protein